MLRRRRLPREQLLALRAALLPGPLAHEAFAEWRELVDFDATDAPMYRLLPLIYRNLEAQLESDPVLGRMRGIYRRTWVLNAIQIEGGGRAIVALGERDIPTMLLKGAAMIARWTGDSGVRMMADFDLLVPRERALDAVSCLLERGWRPAVDRSGPVTDADLDEEHALLLKSDGGGELDLHWRALMHGGENVSGDATLGQGPGGSPGWPEDLGSGSRRPCASGLLPCHDVDGRRPSGLDCRLRPHHQRDRLGVRLVPSVRPCPTGSLRAGGDDVDRGAQRGSRRGGAAGWNPSPLGCAPPSDLRERRDLLARSRAARAEQDSRALPGPPGAPAAQ